MNSVNNRHEFRMNSLFDPNKTGGGGRPGYFTSLCSANGPFSRYRVYASRIRATYLNEGINQANPFVFGLIASDEVVTALTNADYMTNTSCKWGVHPGGTSAPAQTLSQYRTISAVGGKSPSTIMTEDSYAALYNATPADQLYWTVWAASTDASSIIECRVMVQIEFFAQLEDRIISTVT